jgi:hypothetical protein
MNNISKLLCGALLLAACGDDNAKTPDAPPVAHDAAVDAAPPPAPPTLGAQIDRLGRPTINTALNHAFDATAGRGPAKDAYNADGAKGTWQATYVPAFAPNLAVFDAVDTGLSNIPGAGCGNQILYDNTVATDPTLANIHAYGKAAGVLADDVLYTDTAKGTCALYLAIEVEIATGGAVPHTTCGGRTPSYDVIDVTYSAVAGGLAAFNQQTLAPLIKDNADVHADVSDTTFPFLGAPHAP